MTLPTFVSTPPTPGREGGGGGGNHHANTNNDKNTTTTTISTSNDHQHMTTSSDQQQQLVSSTSTQHFSLLRLLCMFAVSFSYGLVFNTVNNIVIPNEIERLTTSRQSMWVGLIMASGAVSQFATPVAGAWSDRTGDRVKFLLAGSLVTVCGVVGFSVVSSSQSVLLLFFSQIVTTVGLSVQYAMVTALLNDHVPAHQAGAGSGALAILGILGSGVGYSLFALNIPSQYSFMCYIGCTIGCVAISTFFIPSSTSSSTLSSTNNNNNSKVPSALDTSGVGDTPAASQPSSASVLRASNNNNNKQQGWGAGQGHTTTGGTGGPVVLMGGGDSTPTRRGSPATPGPNPTKRHTGSGGGTTTTTGGNNNNSANIIVSSSSKIDHMALLPPASYRPKQRYHRQALRRLTNGTLQRAEAASTSCLAFFGDMLPSPTKAPDFFFACLGRGLFNCGLSGQVYLVYYLRDIILVHNPIQIASLVAVGALVGGIVGALPAGILSDRVGKKPIIYVAIGVCVVSLMMFLMVTSVNTVQIIGFVYGIGNVGYLSVDYALGVQSLPSTTTTSSSKKRLHHRGNNHRSSSSTKRGDDGVEMGRMGGGDAGDQDDDIAEMTSMNFRGNHNHQNHTHHNSMDKSYDSEGGSENEGSYGEEEDLIHGDMSSLPTITTNNKNNNNNPYSGGTDETTTTKSPPLVSQTVGGGGETSCDEIQHHHHRAAAGGAVASNKRSQPNNNNNRRTTGGGVRRIGSQSKGAAHAGKDLGVFAMSATFGQVAGQLIFGIVLDQFSISSMEPNIGSHAVSIPTTIITTTTPGVVVAAGGGGTTTIPPSSTTHQYVDGHHEVIRYTYMGFIVIYSLGAVAFILSGVFTSYIKNVD